MLLPDTVTHTEAPALALLAQLPEAAELTEGEGEAEPPAALLLLRALLLTETLPDMEARVERELLAVLLPVATAEAVARKLPREPEPLRLTEALPEALPLRGTEPESPGEPEPSTVQLPLGLVLPDTLAELQTEGPTEALLSPAGELLPLLLPCRALWLLAALPEALALTLPLALAPALPEPAAAPPPAPAPAPAPAEPLAAPVGEAA